MSVPLSATAATDADGAPWQGVGSSRGRPCIQTNNSCWLFAASCDLPRVANTNTLMQNMRKQ
eukprot:9553601-Lingulodinium_polyedra.AAC.1